MFRSCLLLCTSLLIVASAAQAKPAVHLLKRKSAPAARSGGKVNAHTLLPNPHLKSAAQASGDVQDVVRTEPAILSPDPAPDFQAPQGALYTTSDDCG